MKRKKKIKSQYLHTNFTNDGIPLEVSTELQSSVISNGFSNPSVKYIDDHSIEKQIFN